MTFVARERGLVIRRWLAGSRFSSQVILIRRFNGSVVHTLIPLSHRIFLSSKQVSHFLAPRCREALSGGDPVGVLGGPDPLTFWQCGGPSVHGRTRHF